jgi:methyltransferase-like protein
LEWLFCNNNRELNPTVYYIWNQLDGKKSLKAVLDGLLEEFEVEEETARQDMAEFIEELTRENLIAEAL